MIELFSQGVLDIYRGIRTEPLDSFQAWLFNRAKSLLSFDSAAWGTGVISGDGVIVHALYLHDLPQSFINTWERYKYDDRTVHRVALNPGQTINVNVREEYAGTEILEHHCKPVSMEHILCTVQINPDTGLYHLIALYRSDSNRPFSEEERKLQQALFPHLIETYRNNWVRHIEASQGMARENGHAMAAVDVKGIFHTAEDAFSKMLIAEWPEWRGHQLPAELLKAKDTNREQFVGNKITARFSKLADLTLILVRERDSVDTLSPRETEVATHCCSGLTSKQIAQKLKLSPSTVRNHLNTIYLKLGINNKADLVNKLKSR